MPNKPMLLAASVKASALLKGRCPAAALSLPLVVAAARCNLECLARQQIGKSLIYHDPVKY